MMIRLVHCRLLLFSVGGVEHELCKIRTTHAHPETVPAQRLPKESLNIVIKRPLIPC